MAVSAADMESLRRQYIATSTEINDMAHRHWREETAVRERYLDVSARFHAALNHPANAGHPAAQPITATLGRNPSYGQPQTATMHQYQHQAPVHPQLQPHPSGSFMTSPPQDESPQAPATVEKRKPGRPPKEGGKEKKIRDPNAPKRPASAYLMFQNDVRDAIRAENPGLPYKDVLAEISKRWKESPQSVKDSYMDRYNTEAAEHKIAEAAYRTGSVAPPAANVDADAGSDDSESESSDSDSTANPAPAAAPASKSTPAKGPTTPHAAHAGLAAAPETPSAAAASAKKDKKRKNKDEEAAVAAAIEPATDKKKNKKKKDASA